MPAENHRKTTKNQENLGTPTKNQGPCPKLKGFCINALTVWDHWEAVSRKCGSGPEHGHETVL